MLEQLENTAPANSSTAWESRIDQLATQVMIGGFDPSVMLELRSLADGAEQGGFAECAGMAQALAARLDTAGAAEAEELLKKGFTQLRGAMQREQSGEAPETPPPTYASLGDDAELVADFLIEAREHLSQIEGQMLILEKDPQSIEVVHTVFRAFHTIKGLAGFLGFSVVQQVAHEVETLLDLARNEKLLVDSAIVDVVLESGDFLLNEMAAIDRVLSGGSPLAAADNRQLIDKIRALAIAKTEGVEEAQEPVVEVAVAAAPVAPLTPIVVVTTVVTAPAPPPAKEAVAVAEAAPIPQAPAQIVAVAAPAPVVVPPPPAPVETNATPAAEQLWAMDPTAPPASPTRAAAGVPVAVPREKKPELVRPAEPAKAQDAGSVRVETAKLDHLMDMVGEMVIAQSLIRHSPLLASSTDTRLVGDLSQLARVTAEVQRATMSMRMVPVGQLFQKIERVIRDLSRKAGKQVMLETSGTDTEVDKTVAEELSDPLLHMVRNSVDHGIETAAERVTSGKEPTARIRLAAYHQGGQVVIEISDDGRGLNADKIRKKAEEKDLITSTEVLTETEVFQLIFAPGFSTAEKITDVSGRGVGMDVVRRNVEKLRGRIDTQSVLGKGTTFLLKLPLTLAIIDGLVVEVGTHRYIIPLSTVREIFRPLGDTLFTVEGRDEMVLVREKLLPIVRLNQRLGIEARAVAPADGLLVIIESESKLFCLLVDDLIGKQEVVIKGLGDVFEDVSGVSGCAVLGNGQVGLILDTDGVYRGRRR